MATDINNTKYTANGFISNRNGFGPAIVNEIDLTDGSSIAANQVLALIKIPEKSVPRLLVVEVLRAATGTCTVDIGKDIDGTTTGQAFKDGHNAAEVGDTAYALDGTLWVAGPNDHITLKAVNEINDAILRFTVFVDVADHNAEFLKA